MRPIRESLPFFNFDAYRSCFFASKGSSGVGYWSGLSIEASPAQGARVPQGSNNYTHPKSLPQPSERFVVPICAAERSRHQTHRGPERTGCQGLERTKFWGSLAGPRCSQVAPQAMSAPLAVGSSHVIFTITKAELGSKES